LCKKQASSTALNVYRSGISFSDFSSASIASASLGFGNCGRGRHGLVPARRDHNTMQSMSANRVFAMVTVKKHTLNHLRNNTFGLSRLDFMATIYVVRAKLYINVVGITFSSLLMSSTWRAFRASPSPLFARQFRVL
jgi:hypothetical protein